MTLGEAIARYNALEENSLTTAEKISLISHLDGRLHREILSRYENAGEFSGYGEDEDLTTVLLAPFPYDDVYRTYLLAAGALYDGNTQRYNNFSTLTNSVIEEYAAFVHKNGTVKENKIRQAGE